jgi:hypothetical protein
MEKNKREKEVRKSIPIKISKKTRETLSRPHKLIDKPPPLTWSRLRPTYNKKMLKNALVQNKNSNVETIETNLYEKIKYSITYPKNFIENNISGKVIADLYFDKNGMYIERLSMFKSYSNYLSIHVRKILRKSLHNSIKIEKMKRGPYRAIFHFHLTTGLENPLKNNKKLYFYTKGYGGTSSIDNLNEGLARVASTISNVLTLVKFLPSNIKKQNIKKRQFLRSYQNDKYWGK